MSDRWKNIPKQTFLVENGQIGDCWRCCIAAVVGLPAEDVPHFLDDGKGKYNNACDADTQAWLNDRGWSMVYAVSNGSRESIWFPKYASSNNDPPALITCGPTERSKGMGKHHAVVTVGGKLVYDPHPSEAGLTGIAEQYLIFKQ